MTPTKSAARTWRESLRRMRWILGHWRKIDHIDREFLLRKWRDEYPAEFWMVASEKKPWIAGVAR